MKVRDVHIDSLQTSTTLSRYYVKNFIDPLAVVRVLNQAGVKFMLLGAHGLGGWMQKPRATEDVDVLVAQRGHKKAVRALLDAYPHLQVEDHPVVTRLRDPETGKIVIDVMKANQELFRDALKHTHSVSAGRLTYKIPTLELALTMKFAAMISPNRPDEDKYQDAHDFIYIIRSNSKIDLEKLSGFGELVYSGGGQEIVEKVRQVRAGEKMSL